LTFSSHPPKMVTFLSSSYTITTRTLSAFPDDDLSSVLVNSAAKKFTLLFVCHPSMVSPGACADGGPTYTFSNSDKPHLAPPLWRFCAYGAVYKMS